MGIFKNKKNLLAILFILIALALHGDFFGMAIDGDDIRVSGKYIAEHEADFDKDVVEKISYIDPSIFLIACSAVLVGALGMVILNLKLDGTEDNEIKMKQSDENVDNKVK